MMHYSSKPETNVDVTNEGMLLIDSGGQYLEGTTDITRRFVFGDISEEERYWFTKLQEDTFVYLMRTSYLDVQD